MPLVFAVYRKKDGKLFSISSSGPPDLDSKYSVKNFPSVPVSYDWDEVALEFIPRILDVKVSKDQFLSLLTPDELKDLYLLPSNPALSAKEKISLDFMFWILSSFNTLNLTTGPVVVGLDILKAYGGISEARLIKVLSV